MFGQVVLRNPYGMNSEQTNTWLKEVSKADKEQQLTLIQNRFFKQNEFKKSETDDVPIILANGIILNELTNIKLKNYLSNQLTTENVNISILEKEPEGLYVNKRWPGVIILTINDRKTKRLLNRIGLK